MKTKKVPDDARPLRAYAELESYLVDFVQGRYPFLWVLGRPGISKTESLRAATRGHNVYYQKGGQITPLQFYIDCYEHRGHPVVIDDAEHLLDNKIGGKLVSALGDTTAAKLMCWATTSRALGDTPQSYWTTSSLCVIANKNTTDAAIQSRALTLKFSPTNLEIHRAVSAGFGTRRSTTGSVGTCTACLRLTPAGTARPTTTSSPTATGAKSSWPRTPRPNKLASSRTSSRTPRTPPAGTRSGATRNSWRAKRVTPGAPTCACSTG